ncbi:FKBP-type peptidyl-prolyl cis-trans isomerase [Aeromicrobium sp. CF4.19]|uniref:FKBP-type peptidyl-prolyl cis-trans isomerase n=1 Tax=Aeromicrobium sp. CF4.19 TaxID=3373082 RepID=UPI003EE54054
MRRILALALTSTLVLAGCGGSSGAGLEDITIGEGANPSVDVPEDFEADSTDTRVVNEGNGEELADGDSVKVNYVAVNGRTGEQFDNSFTGDSPMTVPLQQDAVMPGFVKGLSGQKVGSRVLVAIAPEDGFGAAQDALGIQADDSMVFLFDIVAKVPTEASGEEQDVPESVPEITTEDDEVTGFESTDETADAPSKGAESRSWVAIKGEGDEITAENPSITAHYVGQVYPDGEVFDSSWERGSPSPFQLQQLYPCWQEQVPGNTVGSRIIIECPPGTGGQQPPEGADENDTLLFVVDLLDAS